jgi:hypothetical protein
MALRRAAAAQRSNDRIHTPSGTAGMVRYRSEPVAEEPAVVEEPGERVGGYA